MSDVKLTRQSEEILRQLKADMASGRLTEEQVKCAVKSASARPRVKDSR